MAALSDITGVMGELMLKGWILTDKACSTPGCSVPLMRSPRGHSPEVYFCAKCDGKQSGPAATPAPPSQVTPQPKSSETNNSTASSLSRASTPLTEVSKNPDDDDDDDFQLPPETEESRRRREQSDRASAEIGNRLLKGWAMLGEECPNDSCFGVPLVRPPTKGGEKDPRKVCVICGNEYVIETNVFGRERLVPANSQVASDVRGGGVPETVPALPESTNESKRPVVEEFREEMSPAVSEIQAQAPGFPSRIPVQPLAPPFPPPRGASLPPATLPILHDADQALQHSLQALSANLTRLSSSSAFNPGAIGGTADAMSKVIQALGHLKAFQWSEAQAH